MNGYTQAGITSNLSKPLISKVIKCEDVLTTEGGV